MAALTIQPVPPGGLADVTFGAAGAGGDTVAFGGHRAAGYHLAPILLIVRNGDSGPHDVTVGDGVPVEVAAGDTAVFPVNSPGIGHATVPIVYEAVTSVTVAAVQLVG